MIRLTQWLAAALAVCFLALAAGPALADGKKDKDRDGKRGGARYEYDDGNCRYSYKSTGKGYKEEVKCRRKPRHAWGPPPWAPAHGYRAKARTQPSVPYVPPFDLGDGRCNRQVLGAILGGVAGGAIGSQIGKGDERTVAIIGGTLVGILVGGGIGRMMDQVDQSCIGQALEHAPDGQTIVWNDARAGAQYQVVPTKTVQQADGRYCREYTTVATVGGKAQTVYGRACRQPDGAWQIGG